MEWQNSCVATAAEGRGYGGSKVVRLRFRFRAEPEADKPLQHAQNDEGGELLTLTIAPDISLTIHTQWMVRILKPYIEEKIAVNQLPPDQRAILLIDCYPVHIGLDFRTYVWTEFPNIFLIFVPANCTGIFQPADVGLQRIIKHQLRQAALRFLVAEHRKQVKSGLTPEQVKVTTSLPVLRDASVRGIVDAWQFMTGPTGRDIVRRVSHCCIMSFRLNSDSLFYINSTGVGEMRRWRVESLTRCHPEPTSKTSLSAVPGHRRNLSH